MWSFSGTVLDPVTSSALIDDDIRVEYLTGGAAASWDHISNAISIFPTPLLLLKMLASAASRSLRTTTTSATRLTQLTRHLSPKAQQIRMAHNGTTFSLNTGAKIPAIGFGTWQDKESQEPYVCCIERRR
jgi:hypothetical protein